MELIFATNNQHKVDEIRFALRSALNIKTLKQAGIDIDIEEPFETLEENAKEKCRVIYELTRSACFSEDTGLEVLALGGAPGVRSARYAGEPPNPQANIEKLLNELKDKSIRDARFRTVICLVLKKRNIFLKELVRDGLRILRKVPMVLVMIRFLFQLGLTKHLQKWK